MERTQFTWYESFSKAIKRIKKKADRCDAYDAISDYALYGREPDLDQLPDSAAIAFELIRPNLDASRRKANAGKSGGSAKQNASKAEAERKQEETEREKEKEKEKEKENECYPPTPLPDGKGKRQSRFIPPTVEEVCAYCLERGNDVDPEQFVDFYMARGWRYGPGRPIVDWKAAVRTWEKRGEKKGGEDDYWTK